MNIKDAAVRTGLTSKTIRYYEDIGLLHPARNDNGYRDFSEEDLHRLAFIGRGRQLGFSVEECRSLLDLYGDTERTSAEVKAIASEHLKKVDQKLAEMQDMRDTLAHLVSCCKGNDRPDCPILSDLAGS